MGILRGKTRHVYNAVNPARGQMEFLLIPKGSAARAPGWLRISRSSLKRPSWDQSHFICDVCARRHLHCEILIQAGMVLCYPIFLFVIRPLLGATDLLPHFLVKLFWWSYRSPVWQPQRTYFCRSGRQGSPWLICAIGQPSGCESPGLGSI